MKLVNIKIDVEKITKDRLFKGKKGTYLDLMVSINDEPDQFGNDASVWENQTKEEREGKENRNFLGNGKVVWKSKGTTSTAINDDFHSDGDGLPF